jgi:hypothetical protein
MLPFVVFSELRNSSSIQPTGNCPDLNPFRSVRLAYGCSRSKAVFLHQKNRTSAFGCQKPLLQ